MSTLEGPGGSGAAVGTASIGRGCVVKCAEIGSVEALAAVAGVGVDSMCARPAPVRLRFHLPATPLSPNVIGCECPRRVAGRRASTWPVYGVVLHGSFLRETPRGEGWIDDASFCRTPPIDGGETSSSRARRSRDPVMSASSWVDWLAAMGSVGLCAGRGTGPRGHGGRVC